MQPQPLPTRRLCVPVIFLTGEGEFQCKGDGFPKAAEEAGASNPPCRSCGPWLLLPAFSDKTLRTQRHAALADFSPTSSF